MKLAEALDLVEPFVSTDDTRPHLCKPARHSRHVVATDGHTMGVVRFEEREPDDRQRCLDMTQHNAPSWEYAVPSDLKCIGEITRADVEPLRHFPTRWVTAATIAVGGDLFVEACVPPRTGKHGKVLRPRIVTVPRVKLCETALRPKELISLNAGYLARCFDLATLGFLPSCHLYADGPLDPFVFAPDTADSKKKLLELPRFAVMMGVRL